MTGSGATDAVGSRSRSTARVEGVIGSVKADVQLFIIFFLREPGQQKRKKNIYRTEGK